MNDECSVSCTLDKNSVRRRTVHFYRFRCSSGCQKQWCSNVHNVRKKKMIFISPNGGV